MRAQLVRRVVRKALPTFHPFMRGARALRTLKRMKAITFLVYHEIADTVPEGLSPGLVTSIERFRREMTWASQHFEMISIAEALQRLARGRLESHAIVVSFDDGYRGVLDNALPVLDDHGIPAVFFLNSAFCVKRGVGLRLKLEWLLKRKAWAELTQWIPGPKDPIAFVALARQALPATVRDTIDALFEDSGGAQLSGRYFHAEDLKALPSGRLTFANHGRTHAWLPGLSNSGQEEEIVGGQQELEALPGVTPYFALPFGTPESYNAATLALVTRYYGGYLLTGYGGINTKSKGKRPLLNVRRNCISEQKPSLLELLWSNYVTTALLG